jgi:hypothetical protein
MSDTYLPNRAGEVARRVDTLKAERDRLRGAVELAMDAMGDPHRSNVEILSTVHSILSRVMAD